MEKTRGIARNVRHSVEGKWPKVVFEIGSKPIELSVGRDSIILDDGDEIIVAGKEKRGLFKGEVYNNVTRGVIGYESTGLNLFMAVLFTALCGLVWLFFTSKHDYSFATLMSIPLLPVALLNWYPVYRTFAASKAVRS